MISESISPPRRRLLDMNGYQWTVLLAAWLGWGFDCFDSLLFNFVAPNCIPTLLHLPLGTAAAKMATLRWTGIMTSVLLLGWAAGGVLFGAVADRIGRTKTLLLTMILYAIGTALCALAPNLGVLLVFRLLAGLGIGGEWAAGASLVAEVVPEKRRVEAGALLYTSACFGLFLGTVVNKIVAGGYFRSVPELSWRYVLLCGLIPALVALIVRTFIKEPERWQKHAVQTVRLSDLFQPEMRARTFSGLISALVVLVTWWSCNAFIGVLATNLAQTSALMEGLNKALTLARVEDWKTYGTNLFNLGGLLGILLTIPAAKILGRRGMFALYFVLAATAFFVTFGLTWSPHTRLGLLFFEGLTIFGIFGSFTFYLPELFPTRLRATGAGFCYNIGRVVAAAGPFLVGWAAAHGAQGILHVLFWIGFVPLLGACITPWLVETKSSPLID